MLIEYKFDKLDLNISRIEIEVKAPDGKIVDKIGYKDTRERIMHIRSNAFPSHINLLGQILYALKIREPVIHHLMNEVYIWNAPFHNEQQLVNDAEKMDNLFPHLSFSKKYLPCMIRRLKEGKK